MKKAFILGGGGWGTALGLVLAETFEKVLLWEHEQAYAAEMEVSRENTRYLPGVALAPNMHATSDAASMAQADMLVLAVPSQYFRSVWAAHHRLSRPEQLAVVVTKGIEPGSLLTMAQVAADECGKSGHACPRFVTLSGPSHAEEVGRRLPTTVVAAAEHQADAREVQTAFNRDWFRVYTSTDHLGVELGGSLKNVIALAAGICDGLGLGDNAKAALITRGLAEITRLGVAMGARASTFSGLTGLGDLVVTCMSVHSRNRSIGMRLGQGERWSEISKTFKQAVEGAVTAQACAELALKYKVELPIAREVNAVLYEDKDPRAALRDLLHRVARDEEEQA